MVFSEPFEASNGTVIVTVSNSRGRAVGIYTVTAQSVTWTPAVDDSRVALIAVCTGFVAAVLGTAAVLRRPPWPDLTERAMGAISEAKFAARKS
jgi:hypothetical protein